MAGTGVRDGALDCRRPGFPRISPSPPVRGIAYGFSLSHIVILNLFQHDDCRWDIIICDSPAGWQHGALTEGCNPSPEPDCQLPAIAQRRCDRVDRQFDAFLDARIILARPVALEQFDLEQVERLDIG